MENKSVYAVLSKVNVNDKTEKKNGLTYLSWAWAWGVLKEHYPTASYTIYENAQGWNYHTDGKTAWVKTGVTVEGIEHIEYLPVMDFRNKSIPTEQLTSFDVNKTIQRSLTKAVARHGLALYVFAGEDLPEDNDVKPNQLVKNETEKARDTTVFNLNQLYTTLNEELKSSVNEFLKVRNVMKFADLSEGVAQALLVNIQKKIALTEKE